MTTIAVLTVMETAQETVVVILPPAVLAVTETARETVTATKETVVPPVEEIV